MLLDDPGGKVKKIIKIWLDNVASVDRRLRLLDKMQKMRKAKMSTMTMVRFHSEFQGRVIIIYANFYILYLFSIPIDGDIYPYHRTHAKRPPS